MKTFVELGDDMMTLNHSIIFSSDNKNPTFLENLQKISLREHSSSFYIDEYGNHKAELKFRVDINFTVLSTLCSLMAQSNPRIEVKFFNGEGTCSFSETFVIKKLRMSTIKPFQTDKVFLSVVDKEPLLLYVSLLLGAIEECQK